MEYKEAVKYLKIVREGTENDNIGQLQKCVYDTSIEALEKPIPKDRTEVIHLNKGDEPHEWREIKRQDWVCPVCGSFVGQGHNAFQIKPHDQKKCNYCNDCGQAINWEGVKEE